jgi:hypothetical protein
VPQLWQMNCVLAFAINYSFSPGFQAKQTRRLIESISCLG